MANQGVGKPIRKTIPVLTQSKIPVATQSMELRPQPSNTMSISKVDIYRQSHKLNISRPTAFSSQSYEEKLEKQITDCRIDPLDEETDFWGGAAGRSFDETHSEDLNEIKGLWLGDETNQKPSALVMNNFAKSPGKG